MLATIYNVATIKVQEHARERFMKAAMKMENRYNVQNSRREIWWQ